MSRKHKDESLFFLLSAICKAQRGQANESLAALGLYAGQEMFLWQLWGEDGLTQTQLGERMCVQPPTISKMIDRMENAGLVTTRPDSEDGRTSRVYLTEQGRSIEQPVSDVFRNLEKQLTHGLSAEERTVLRRLLLQVQKNLNPAPQTVS
jgi:MarR family transcriptional regulator, organic hydroperoxide resistance regulator